MTAAPPIAPSTREPRTTHADATTSARSHHAVHLINRFEDATGGSELRTLSLYDQLRDSCRIRLWSEYSPNAELARAYPIRRVAARRLRLPLTGTFVFVGVYKPPRRWVRITRPRRVIVVYNTPDPDLLRVMIDTLQPQCARPVEVVFASEALSRTVAYPGVVQASPIDLQRFSPGPRQLDPVSRDDFVVGRLSRDVALKHHDHDPALYARLAAAGVRVRIMGGTCLRERLRPWLDAADGRIALLPVGSVAPETFLRDLDCFLYRTSPEWDEPFGRVIMEAMASGLPVVCEARGGYTELVEHGRNGFLFRGDVEAFDIVERLRADPALRRTIAHAARDTVERVYSADRRRQIIDFYTR